MARHYTVPIGTDAEQTVRKFYLDGADVPTAGLTVAFILRDCTGTVVAMGDLVDLNALVAPGWYKLPSQVFLDRAGIWTVEYAPPVGFAADADTLFVSTPVGTAQAYFVKGG